MKRTIVTLAVLAGLAGCGPDTDENDRVGAFAGCGDFSTGTDDTSPEVAGTIAALVPSASAIVCTGKQAFDLDGRTVQLVEIDYGRLNDCPAGCFESNLCAIYDQGDVALYSAIWQWPDERPLSIPPDCPELADGDGGGITGPGDCPARPEGYAHPVTQTESFQDFKTARMHSGTFHACFEPDFY